VVEIREIGTMVVSLMEDRKQLKWRMNLIRDGKISGFLKPVKTF
jgi:hypothetical protein